jgi:hypothetical protein
LVIKKGDEMPAKGKKEVKKEEPKDINIVRTRINELYVILEGMNARLDEVERIAKRAAQRLGV